MFHLSDKQTRNLYEEFHRLSAEAADAQQWDRADAMREAASLVHKAQMEAFDQRSATASRRRQPQLQGARR